MQAEVVLSPGEFALHQLTGKTAIVIDVFRFTTTILTALEAGIEEFYSVCEIEEAWDLKKQNPDYLLAGERQALAIPGFDFGNSPLEHYGKRYPGKKLVCSTTNGTRAIQAAKEADCVILASLRSAKAIAKYVENKTKDLIFLPAGLAGKFSLEDVWCAGLILSYLKPRELGDGAGTAQLIYEQIFKEELRHSAHGKRLQDLGLDADLDFCLELNASSAVIMINQRTGWGALVR